MYVNFKFVSMMCEREEKERGRGRERERGKSLHYKLVGNMVPDCELLIRLQIRLYAMLYSKNN